MSAILLGRTEREYREQERELAWVQEIVREERGEPVQEEHLTFPTEKERGRLAVCQRLKDANEDVAGRIFLEGTDLDYPVMYTPEDPDFYLTHGFRKEPSVGGMIYMDGNCPLNADSKNRILYGHHMKNGTMFALLEQYLSADFLREHPVICFDTMEETGEYRVISAFRISASDADEEFLPLFLKETREDYEALFAYGRAHGIEAETIEPVWPVRLLALITCDYTRRDGRLVVLACEKKETASGQVAQ